MKCSGILKMISANVGWSIPSGRSQRGTMCMAFCHYTRVFLHGLIRSSKQSSLKATSTPVMCSDARTDAVFRQKKSHAFTLVIWCKSTSFLKECVEFPFW